MDKNKLKAVAIKVVDSIAPELAEISRFLHSHPELGENEYQALAYLTAAIARHGFQVQKNIGGCKTAFIARQGQGEPQIAFLAEYDALPKLGHACGHNLIAAMSFGAAAAFAAVAGKTATSYLIGCPAEETTGGKIALAEAGVFDDLSAALIIHPSDRNTVGGTSYATHPLRVAFHGKPAHVASRTDKGVNALDALVLFYNGLAALRRTFTEENILAGIITKGGIAPNIIPDEAEMKLTVRSLSYRYLEETMLPAVKRLAAGIAQATGTTVAMDHYEPLYKELKNDEALLKLYQTNMAQLGEPVERLDDREADGSTDVGTVSQIIPTLHPDIQIGTHISAHTPEFAVAAGSPEAEKRLLVGAKVMALTAIDLLP